MGGAPADECYEYKIGRLAVVIIIYWSLGLIAYFFAKWWYSANTKSNKN